MEAIKRINKQETIQLLSTFTHWHLIVRMCHGAYNMCLNEALRGQAFD